MTDRPRTFFTFQVPAPDEPLTGEDAVRFRRRRTVAIVVAALLVLIGLAIIGNVVVGNVTRSNQAAADAAAARATTDYIRQEVAFRDQGLCYALRYHVHDPRVAKAYQQFECKALLALPPIIRPTPPAGVSPIAPSFTHPPGIGLATPHPMLTSPPQPQPSAPTAPAPVPQSHPPSTTSPSASPTGHPTPTRSASATPTPDPSPLVCVTTKLLGRICTPAQPFGRGRDIVAGPRAP